jgi:flavin-dependent dehydrogenase
MTGDGIHLAITSAVLAAKAALATLETGDFSGGLERLSYARRVAFHRKLQFNRFLRRLVDSPLAIDLASRGAAVLPGMVRRAVTYAGDAA